MGLSWIRMGPKIRTSILRKEEDTKKEIIDMEKFGAF